MARPHPHDRLRPRSGAFPRALAATVVGLGGAACSFAPAFGQATDSTGASAASATQAQSFLDEIPRLTADAPVPYRPHPQWDPLGVHAGAFIIFPSLTESVGVNDNIFATPSAPVTDTIFTTNPQIIINSDWNQNSVNFEAQATLSRYADRSDQDTDTWNANTGGTLNIYHDLSAQANATIGRYVLLRTSDSYAEFSRTPIYYDQSSVQVSVNKQFNRLQLSFQESYTDDSFLNGQQPDGKVLEQGFRDQWGYQSYLRVNYEVSNYIRPFFEAIIQKNSLASTFRDQLQTETLVGADVAITHLMVAEGAVGYLTDSYGGPTHPPSAGNITGRVKLIYFPTELITVTLSLQQSVFDSGYSTVPGYISTNPSVEVDYELFRNLIITAKFGESFNQFEGGTNESQRSFNANIDATYKISRDVWLTAGYIHSDRTSNATSFAVIPFSDDFFSLSITLQR